MSEDRILTIAEALREGIAEEMERDERVFCIGEDIGIPGGWGGAFTVTLGLEEKFPKRTVNTPISEIALFGAGAGRGDDGHDPDSRRAIRRFSVLRNGPDREPDIDDAVYVGRKGERAHRDARACRGIQQGSAACAFHGAMVHQHTGHKGYIARPTHTTPKAC